MLTLRDFKDWLPRIESPIEAIALQADQPDLRWKILNALSAKRAHLFADGDDFCVFRPVIEDGHRLIEVWVAHGKSGNFIARSRAQAIELAKQVDAVGFQFWTVLPALNRYALRLGFTKVRTQNQYTIWRMLL